MSGADPVTALPPSKSAAVGPRSPQVGGSSNLAEANRHSPSLNGAAYTGWIISNDGGRNYSDAISRKADALAYLRVIADQNVLAAKDNR